VNIGRIVGIVVLIWIAIWVVKHPDVASTDFHNAWHAIFGSAG
jgi:hypothetical protein